MPARDQPIRDVRAMAVVRIAFRAHNAHALAALGERGGGIAERGRLHVAAIRHLAIPAERPALPFVLNAGVLQRGGEDRAREMGVSPRHRKRAHIDERTHFRGLENRDEFGRAARAVTDGEDQAALAAFFSSVLASFFFLSLSSSAFAAGVSSGRSISM